MSHYNYNAIKGNDFHEMESNTSEQAFDFARFLDVLRKSYKIGVILLIILLVLAYLKNRYTPDIYRAASDIKLEVENNTIGLSVDLNRDDDFQELTGEIEVLKSDSFISKVVDEIDLELSIWYYGRVLEKERYLNPEFDVDYKITNQKYYDKKIDIEFKDERNFTLSFFDDWKQPIHASFGKQIVMDGLTLTIKKRKPVKAGDRLFFIFNSKPRIHAYLKNRMDVIVKNLNARILTLSFDSETPQKGIDILNVVHTAYLNVTIEKKNLENKNKIAFMNQELDAIKADINSFYNYTEDFTIKNRSVSVEEDLKRSIQFLVEIDSHQYVLKKKLTQLDTLKQAFNNKENDYNLVFMSQEFPDNVKKWIEEYIALIERRKQHKSSSKSNTQAGKLLATKVNLLEERLDEYLIAEDKKVNDKLKELQIKKEKLLSSIQNLPAKGSEFVKKKKDFELQEGMFFELYQKKLNFEILMAGTQPKFQVLSPATVMPGTLNTPNSIIYLLAIVFFVILMSIILGILYLLHNKITGEEYLNKLKSTPLLGGIIFLKKLNKTQAFILSQINAKGRLMESFRMIRSNLSFLLNTQNKEGTTILITSNISGEGKTFVSLNLAHVLAISGKKTIIIDLDLRKPSLYKYMSSQSSKLEEEGVTTLISGKNKLSDVIYDTKIDNLYFLPGGPIAPNPSELILGHGFDEMLDELKSEFEFVIFDTSPVGLVSDAIQVMKKTDINIFVFRQNYSRIASIRTVNKVIQLNNLKNTATVLNGVRREGSYGYGYNYYASENDAYFKEPSEDKISFVNKIKSKLNI